MEKELEARTRELSEALEQHTATSDVLGIISSSPGELEPVFSAMLSNALRICEARFGNLFLYENGLFREVSNVNAPPGFEALFNGPPLLQIRVLVSHESSALSRSRISRILGSWKHTQVAIRSW